MARLLARCALLVPGERAAKPIGVSLCLHQSAMTKLRSIFSVGSGVKTRFMRAELST